MTTRLYLTILLVISLAINTVISEPAMAGKQTLNLLYIGNSFSVWNDLPDVIKRMAAAGKPGSMVTSTSVVSGGQTLESLWKNYDAGQWLRISKLTIEEQQKKCSALAISADKDPTNRVAFHALRSQQRLLKKLRTNPPNWDYVVLQSYMDTDEELESAYAKFARKFAKVANDHGIGVILYATAVRALNAKPLRKAPDSEPISRHAAFFKKLARELDALVVPVFYGVYRCQKADPSITLRWKKNSHPHQRCTYLTAFMFYSVLFDKNPQGISLNEVCFRKKKRSDTDPDGNPRCLVFSAAERSFFQKIAWQSLQDFMMIPQPAT